ncbi:GAS2 domain protein [Aspergillus ruber CBS 135680]|uniref:GAR domain-containing protein n=1 Tax=Aspergillus ruber (strain CBS 135680) TaxID=1388766 RepID=A0A017SJ85_ASPRC|nr:uncharacterized protein EURHEDRAFT_452349 [Aspergillus ruber CBS 135680]EYE96724.1 hypothetical protein EURHEDRAFT_452349 [Aspergillus ruber CBS 135680]
MAFNSPSLGNPPLPFRPSHPSKSSSDNSSRASIRPVPAYELDPLLRTLSPEATLQALSSTDAVPNNEKAAHDALSQSISQVSPADRALGIRAAIAAKNLTLWYKEVQSWEWPKRADAHQGKAFIPPSPSTVTDSGVEYLGSLPSAVVEQHGARIEEIRDAMDNLGVEELKEHVLNAHIPSRSRPSSSGSTMSIPPPLSYVQLSDFTAVITATILRALPTLSRLNTLLSTWDVRLLVLRQIPSLLLSLRLTKDTLDDAFRALKSRDTPTEHDPLYSRSNFHGKQAELGAAVAAAGRRMDNVLDALEGREDSLPENWIDDLETIESEFSTWVVEAEKRSAENEWSRANADHPCQQSDDAPRVSEPVVTTSDSARRNARSFPMETIAEEETTSVAPSVNETLDKPEPESQADPTSIPKITERLATPIEHDATPVPQPVREEPTSSFSELQKQITPSPEIAQPERPRTAIDSPQLSPKSPPARDTQFDKSIPPFFLEAPLPRELEQAPDTRANIASGITQESIPDSQTLTGEPVSVQAEPANDPPSKTVPEPLPVAIEDKPAALSSAVAADDAPVSVSASLREQPPPAVKPSLEPLPCSLPEMAKEATLQPNSSEEDGPSPPKQHLESPIKLGRQAGDKNGKTRQRVTSDASMGSLSSFPSLMSSPDFQEPHAESSNATPLFLDTPPHFQDVFGQPGVASSNNDHTLREDSLRRFDQKVSPRPQHNRAVSLPLQRFINERLDMNYENGAGMEDSPSMGRRPSVASHPEQQEPTNRDGASTPTARFRQLAYRSETPRDTKTRPTPIRSKTDGPVSGPRSSPRKVPLRTSAQRSLNAQPSARFATARLSKELNNNGSRESLTSRGRPGSKSQSRAQTPADLAPRKTNSGSSTPLSKKKDYLDEKISTILDTLPARIQLLSEAQDDDDTFSVTSAAPVPTRGRYRSSSSASLYGAPAPSLTLTPAHTRRRQSFARGPEESSVKLYHLHKNGKSKPTKLFVRSVGESGERVMVRVGGGWADLGEYLREYAIHHGRRHVSETPRVEVQGLKSHESTPGNNMLTPAPSNGRRTPSRPRSVISNRPTSSLAVRKTRRASNVSDATDFRAASFGEPTNPSHSPMSTRRHSVSSNNSVGTISFASEAHYGSSAHSPATTIAAGSSRSTPLGLAGPKPRSRQKSMSPESEAWVEDVLGQARRSSLRPKGMPPTDRETTPDVPPVPALPKVRSVSDMGSAGNSRRVMLRGLDSRRNSRQG